MPENEQPVDQPRRMDPRLRMVVRHLTRLVDGLDPAIQGQVQQTIAALSEAEFRRGPGGGRRCPMCGKPVSGV